MDHGALLAWEGETAAVVCAPVPGAVVPVCGLPVAPFVLGSFGVFVLFLAMPVLPVLWESPGGQRPD